MSTSSTWRARLGLPAATKRSLLRSISTKSGPAGRCSRTFQYITHPGGGATNPLGVNQPGKILKDAAVFGLRTVLKF